MIIIISWLFRLSLCLTMMMNVGNRITTTHEWNLVWQHSIIAVKGRLGSIQLLPSLLFFMGYCRTSIGDCLTCNRKYQTFREQGGSDLIRSNNLINSTNSNHVWTNRRLWPGRGSTITAGGKSGSVSGLLSTSVWPALWKRLDRDQMCFHWTWATIICP